MKCFFGIFLSLFSLSLIAQDQAVKVLNEIYCLGLEKCTPNASVAIELPPNTKKWVLMVTATKSPQMAKSIKKNPALFSIFPSLQSKRNRKKVDLEKSGYPLYEGDGNCSVYFLKQFVDSQKFLTPGGAYFYHEKYAEKNITSASMIIEEPQLCSGTQYIGIENARAFFEKYDVFVVLTVVAVTSQ